MGSVTPTPMASFETGVEERSMEWRITNFPVVLKQSSTINSQRFDFLAGDSIGLASKWSAFLQTKEIDGTSWVGLYIRLEEMPETTSANLFVEFTSTFKGTDGLVKKIFDVKLRDWYDRKQVANPLNGYGFKLFDTKGSIPSYMELTAEGSLVVQIIFRMYALIQAFTPFSQKVKVFEMKSALKAKADLAMVMGNPVASTDIRIIANDKSEFKMQRGVLTARSPVFQAMLDADMVEANTGVIQIKDMGSKSLKIMLHYMQWGELLPEWELSQVLLELVNAAAKYELTELLQFLDGVLGTVCTLQNVGALIPLAHRLSLKTAEEGLLSFVRRNGVSSAHNFVRMCEGIVDLDSGEASGTTSGLVVDNIGSRPASISLASRRGRGHPSGSRGTGRGRGRPPGSRGTGRGRGRPSRGSLQGGQGQDRPRTRNMTEDPEENGRGMRTRSIARGIKK